MSKLAAAASRFSSWWHGDRRPPALTADTASGAGLQGGIEDDVPPSNGSAATAPPEGGDLRTDSNQLLVLSDLHLTPHIFEPTLHSLKFIKIYRFRYIECDDTAIQSIQVMG